MTAKHLFIAITILTAAPAVPQVEQTNKYPAAVTHQAEDKRLLGLIALTAAPLLPPVIAQDHPTTVAQAPPEHEDEGQRIFEQNCSRCHNAPEGFSPRISGTIVRHMRVRASLSKHEEEQLLHFFNP